MPNRSESYRLVHLAISDTNQDLAVGLLQRALTYDPESKLAHYHLGMIYAGRGLHCQAAGHFRHIVKCLDATDAPVWFLLARQLHLASEPEEALAAYDETIQRDPLCEKAYLYTAELLLERGQDAGRALSFAEAAKRIRPAACMLPEEAFDRVLAQARAACAATGAQLHHHLEIPGTGSGNFPDFVDDLSDTAGATKAPAPARTRPNYADVGVRTLLSRYPAAEQVLEAHGIRCGNCAGYGDQTLREIVGELGLDLRKIVAALIVSVEEANGKC
jgi:tetratricopeptide (TPR) repeat protein